MDAIILAGGLGTRLKSVVSDVPKPMAMIGSKPFLQLILQQLSSYDISRIILSVGYKYDVICDYFGDAFNHIPILYSVEETPLGTGGAIKKALELALQENVFILNGDTYFDVDLNKLKEVHMTQASDLTFSLKNMTNIDRYGTVVTDDANRVKGFIDKQYLPYGQINGGVYLAKRELFNCLHLSEKFSFESDFIKKYVGYINFCSIISDGYFIDIGIPKDYQRAQKELSI